MAEISLRTQMAHLLRRAGFGATEAELQQYMALGFAGAVDRLLNPEKFPQPDLDQRLASLDLDPATTRDAFQNLQVEWLTRMVTTQRPLQEKIGLFWHNHFATAEEKVRSPFLMRMQYQLFLTMGLGNFRDLVIAVSKDPAMLIWLDGNQNRKASPNENYGRELLELFMLGIGNYTENDVKAAARAFTGWFFKGERSTSPGRQYISGEFAFEPRQHDTGQKTFLGQTGNWDGTDIIDIALKQPACARFIAGKLVSAFIWDNPEPALVARFAQVFVDNKYDLRETMRAILLSPEFSSERALRAKIKSPLELVTGLLRTLGVTVPTRDVLQQVRKMGQEPFNPPNVGGWPHGLGWIGPGSLLDRFNYANRVATARQANNTVAGSLFDPTKFLAGKSFTTAEQLADYFTLLLLDGAISTEQRNALVGYLKLNEKGQIGNFTLDAKTIDSKVRGLIHLIASTPTYQLN